MNNIWSDASKARLYGIYKELAVNPTVQLLILSMVETNLTLNQDQQDQIISFVESLANKLGDQKL